MKIKVLFLATICLLTISACKKNKAPDVIKTEVDVYTAGYTTLPNSTRTVATIWKNGVAQTLSNASSEAISIAVQGNDVYAVGRSRAINGKYVATYWKNGVEKKLTDSVDESYASGIAITSNDVYIIGNTNNYYAVPTQPLFWKNGINQTFNYTGTNATLNAITTYGNDVHIVGTSTNQSGIKATYWKNGTQTVLAGPGRVAHDITVQNNDVHIAGGRPWPAMNMYLPIYWKNGIPSQPGDTTKMPVLYTLSVENGNLYLGGVTEELAPQSKAIATYWKNGNMVKVSDGSVDSDVYSMAVNNDDVYIGGESPIDRAVYWKNKELIPLSNTRSRVYKLVLVPRK